MDYLLIGEFRFEDFLVKAKEETILKIISQISKKFNTMLKKGYDNCILEIICSKFKKSISDIEKDFATSGNYKFFYKMINEFLSYCDKDHDKKEMF